MSQEEKVETLPSIIKSLAQQVASRDAQLKHEQAKFDEELTSARHQLDVIRTERDLAMRDAEGVKMERARLTEQAETIRAKVVAEAERVKLQHQREVAQEKAILSKVKADFELERAESRRQIGHLEQAAAHNAKMIAQLKKEAEDWKSQFIAKSDELKRRTDEWVRQFSRIAGNIEQLSNVHRKSDSQSSPTVVATYESSPPLNNSSTKKKHPFEDATQSRGVRPGIQGLHHISDLSSQCSPQKRSKPQVQSNETPIGVNRTLVKSSSHAALPPDRVIITAHYEVKKEDDEDEDEDPLFSGSHNDPEASVAGDPFSEVVSHKGVIEPAAKRRRTDARTPNTRRVVRDEKAQGDEAENQSSDEDRGMREAGYVRDEFKDEFDEMAIGAEENHKEIYGHRRVNVREVNAGPRTPPQHRAHTQTASHSGGSSNKKRKANPDFVSRKR